MNCNKIKPNFKTNCMVARALLKKGRLREANGIICKLLKFGFIRKKFLWNYLIQSLCISENDPEKALRISRDCLKNQGILPSRFTFSSIIHCFCLQAKMERAIEVLESMTDIKIGYPIDNYVCSSIISGFCRARKPEFALKFYEHIEKMPAFRPNLVTYTSIVNALCRAGRIEEVHDLVLKMENEGIIIDAVFYSSWICGYFREEILTEAFRKHKLMLEQGIRPDTISYTILIDGFCKEGNVEKAMGFFNKMQKQGLVPNLVTYTAIIRGLCKKKKLDEALVMTKRVEELGIRPDEFLYSILIDGLCRTRDMDKVFFLLEEMEKKGIRASLVTYNTVINGLINLGRTKEADDLSDVVVCDNFTYSTLLHGYFLEKNVEGILKTRQRLEESGVLIDVITYNVLIKVLLMVGSIKDAHNLYEEMPDKGLTPNSFTYSTLIHGYSRVGRISEALEIFDAYRKFLLPDLATYSCIILCLCKNGMIEMATDVFHELLGKGLHCDAMIYMKLIKSKFERESEDGVLEFLFGIENYKPEIQNAICDDTIKFLCNKGCFAAALDLLLFVHRKGLVLSSKSYYLVLRSLIYNGNERVIQLIMNMYIKKYGILEPHVPKILVSYICRSDASRGFQFLNNVMGKKMSLSVLTTIIEAFILEGKVYKAQKIIQETEESGIVLDVFPYSMVIDGLCKEGNLHKALELCASMKRQGIRPNTITYNSVINGLCLQGCLLEAFRLFDSLEKIKIFPNDVTYGVLINSLCKEGFLLDAKMLFQRMILAGISPGIFHYNSLIYGYSRYGPMSEALKFLQELENSRFIPDSFTVSAIINGYCQEGDMEAALQIFSDYNRQGMTPDFWGYFCLVKGLFTRGRMEESRSILREMFHMEEVIEMINKTGSKNEQHSLVGILESLCEEGRIEDAIAILGKVECMNFPFERSSYKNTHLKHKITEFCERFDNDEKVMHGGFTDDYHYLMEHKPFDFDSNYSIIASLCSNGKLEKAKELTRKMILDI